MDTQVFTHIKTNMNIGIFKFFTTYLLFFFCMIAIFSRVLCTKKNIHNIDMPEIK